MSRDAIAEGPVFFDRAIEELNGPAVSCFAGCVKQDGGESSRGAAVDDTTEVCYGLVAIGAIEHPQTLAHGARARPPIEEQNVVCRRLAHVYRHECRNVEVLEIVLVCPRVESTHGPLEVGGVAPVDEIACDDLHDTRRLLLSLGRRRVDQDERSQTCSHTAAGQSFHDIPLTFFGRSYSTAPAASFLHRETCSS